MYLFLGHILPLQMSTLHGFKLLCRAPDMFSNFGFSKSWHQGLSQDWQMHGDLWCLFHLEWSENLWNDLYRLYLSVLSRWLYISYLWIKHLWIKKGCRNTRTHLCGVFETHRIRNNTTSFSNQSAMASGSSRINRKSYTAGSHAWHPSPWSNGGMFDQGNPREIETTLPKKRLSLPILMQKFNILILCCGNFGFTYKEVLHLQAMVVS